MEERPATDRWAVVSCGGGLFLPFLHLCCQRSALRRGQKGGTGQWGKKGYRGKGSANDIITGSERGREGK